MKKNIIWRIVTNKLILVNSCTYVLLNKESLKIDLCTVKSQKHFRQWYFALERCNLIKHLLAKINSKRLPLFAATNNNSDKCLER